MKFTRIVLMVGTEDKEANRWDCGCDQTFGCVAPFHRPKDHVYVIAHDRCFIPEEDVEGLKTAVFTEDGGI